MMLNDCPRNGSFSIPYKCAGAIGPVILLTRKENINSGFSIDYAQTVSLRSSILNVPFAKNGDCWNL